MHDGDAPRDETRTAPPAATTAAADGVATRLVPLLTKIMLGEERDTGDELPIRVLAWDGSSVGPPGAPTYVIRHRRALRRLLWKPGELGFARAYVAGELDIEGDVFAALDAVQRVMSGGDGPIRLSGDDKRDIVRTAVTLGAVGPEPKAPPEERGDAHADPMDEPVAFFERIFGEGLAHGTGLWDRAAATRTPETATPALEAASGQGHGGPAPDSEIAVPTVADPQTAGLEAAQAAAHEALAERLGLRPGARVLDLNCGWGSFALYAAVRHRARVVALARTPEQADHVRAQAVAADASVLTRGPDLPDPEGGTFDAIVGLADVAAVDRPARALFDLLAPGGRLVLQQPVGRPAHARHRRTLTSGYLHAHDGEPPRLGAIVDELDDAGLEVRSVTSLRDDHARTLRAWAHLLQRHWDACVELAGPGRTRVWLLYLATSALACENGRIGRYEIWAKRRDSGAGSGHSARAGNGVGHP